MIWEAADGMPTRAAVALARCNVLLEKMREIHNWHVWRRVPADTANECCGAWHLRASIVNAQNNVKITDFNTVRALLGCEATSLDSEFLRFRRIKQLSSSGQHSPRCLNCLTWRLLPSVLTSRIACPKILRHICTRREVLIASEYLNIDIVL